MHTIHTMHLFITAPSAAAQGDCKFQSTSFSNVKCIGSNLLERRDGNVHFIQFNFKFH